MKKLCIFLVIVLLTIVFLPSCSINVNKEIEFFSFDHNITDENSNFFLEPDSLETIVAAPIFYCGNNPLPSKYNDEFFDLKKEKVNRIITESDNLVKISDKLMSTIDKNITSLFDLLETVKGLSEESKEFALQMTDELAIQYSEMLYARSVYEALVQASSDIDYEKEDEYALSTYNFDKTMAAVKSGESVLKTYDHVMNLTAYIYEGLKKENYAKKLLFNVNIKMSLSIFSSQRAKSISDKIVEINTGIEQLELANIYMGLEGIRFVENNLSAIGASIEEIEPNEIVDENSVAFIKEYYTFYETITQEVKEVLLYELEGYKHLEELENKQASILDTFIVYAGGKGSREAYKASEAYKMKMKTKESNESWLKWGWNGVKEGAKIAQDGAGALVDAASIASYATIRSTYGLYNTIKYNSKEGYVKGIEQGFKDTVSDIKNEIDRVGKRQADIGTGVDTYREAGAYLNELSEMSGNGWQMIAEELEDAAGAESRGISIVVGQIGQLCAGTFTSFGQGVMRLADKSSTNGEMARGLMEVGLSLLGGSTNICKSSQVASVGLSRAGGFFQGLKNVCSKEGIKNLAKTATKLKNLKFNMANASYTELGKKLMSKTASTVGSSLDDLFSNMKSLDFKSIVNDTNAADGVQGIRDLFKRNLSASLGGLKAELAAVLKEKGFKEASKLAGSKIWSGTIDFVDTMVGSYFDNKVTDWIAKLDENPTTEQMDKIKEEITEVVEGAVALGVAGAEEASKNSFGKLEYLSDEHPFFPPHQHILKFLEDIGSIDIDNNGQFAEKLTGGTYNVEMDNQQVELKLKEFSINGDFLTDTQEGFGEFSYSYTIQYSKDNEPGRYVISSNYTYDIACSGDLLLEPQSDGTVWFSIMEDTTGTVHIVNHCKDSEGVEKTETQTNPFSMPINTMFMYRFIPAETDAKDGKN